MKSNIKNLNIEELMRECFQLAKKSLGNTSPNPIVGAIVLDKKNTIVGKGFHKFSGGNHAEVEAIKNAGSLARGGILVVSLEPCCHYGKTPPCTDLIIKSGIKKVIFSSYDPNKKVNHKGENTLKKNKIKVISKILEKEGNELNKFFFKWSRKKLPYVTLKQAQSLNGIIGYKNISNFKISSKESLIEVHKLRSEYDAILVGASTVITDNPKLTVRLINGRNPIRIILDKDLKTNPNSEVYKNNAKIILVTKKNPNHKKINRYMKKNNNILILEIEEDNNHSLNLKSLFKKLAKMNILSVLVESGPNLANSLISDNLIDEYIIFQCPKILSSKNSTPSILLETKKGENLSYSMSLLEIKQLGNDLMFLYKPSL